MKPRELPRTGRIVLAKTKRREAGQRAAAAGAALETLLDAHHDTAKMLGLAEVRRVSPHVRHLGPGKVPGSFSAVWDGPGGCDRRGTLRGGRGLVVEAKSTASGNLTWSEFTPAELVDLAAAHQLGALCLVVWELREACAVFAVPWDRIPWKENGNGKSVSAEALGEWRVREAPYLRRFVEEPRRG